MARKKRNDHSALGVIGAVFGTASVVLFFLVWLSLFFGVTGIVFSILQIRHCRTTAAIVGLISSVIGIGLALLTLSVFFFWYIHSLL